MCLRINNNITDQEIKRNLHFLLTIKHCCWNDSNLSNVWLSFLLLPNRWRGTIPHIAIEICFILFSNEYWTAPPPIISPTLTALLLWHMSWTLCQRSVSWHSPPVKTCIIIGNVRFYRVKCNVYNPVSCKIWVISYKPIFKFDHNVTYLRLGCCAPGHASGWHKECTQVVHHEGCLSMGCKLGHIFPH